MVQLRFSLLAAVTQANSLAWMLATIYAVSSPYPAAAQHPAAAQRRPSSWATEKDFDRQLELPSEIQWQETPLRDALQRLSRTQRVALVLDRRIDPGKAVTASVQGANLMDMLRSVGEPHGWGVSVLSNVVYLGPQEAVWPLATWLAKEQAAVARLPHGTRQRWQRSSDASWSDLTEPRPLIEAWLRTSQISARGLDQIPHDLWPAQSLPPLDMLQRLVIALAGFQLAPQVEADGSVQIVPLPSEVTLEQSYRVPVSRRQEIAALQAKLPRATFDSRGVTLQVTGRVEDHQQVQAWLQGPATRPESRRQRTDKRFTLTVQNQPIEAILQAVARQTDLQLVWEIPNAPLQQTRISLAVENATLGELIRTVLSDQPATFRIQGDRLIILPATGQGPSRE